MREQICGYDLWKIMKYEYTVAMIYENKRSELLQNDYNSRKRQKKVV